MKSLWNNILIISSLVICTAQAMEPMELIEPMEIEPIAPASPPPPPAAIAQKKPVLYTLEIPVPGTGQTVAQQLDLANTIDAIATESLEDLLSAAQEEDRDFIIARITTQQGDKYFTEYYELPNLHKALFAGRLFPVGWPDAPSIGRYLQSPTTRATIVGSILYFIYNPATKTFDYFANDFDLFKRRETSPILAIVGASYDPRIKPALANQWYKIGFAYYQKKNFQKAVVYFFRAATLNNTNAMNSLGVIYRLGQGLPAPDYGKALEWYEKAASLNNPIAMSNLGQMYKLGLGLPGPDYGKALEWFHKAAALNDPIAMKSLGSMYRLGEGLPAPDYGKALEWYEKALKFLKPDQPGYKEVLDSIQQVKKQSKRPLEEPAAPESKKIKKEDEPHK